MANEWDSTIQEGLGSAPFNDLWDTKAGDPNLNGKGAARLSNNTTLLSVFFDVKQPGIVRPAATNTEATVWTNITAITTA